MIEELSTYAVTRSLRAGVELPAPVFISGPSYTPARALDEAAHNLGTQYGRGSFREAVHAFGLQLVEVSVEPDGPAGLPVLTPIRTIRRSEWPSIAKQRAALDEPRKLPRSAPAHASERATP